MPDTWKGAFLFICNFTPMERPDYSVGVPKEGVYKEVLSSYSETYENIINIPKKPENELIPCIGYSQVKDNEFFIMSEESNKKIAFMKEKLFSKYKLD